MRIISESGVCLCACVCACARVHIFWSSICSVAKNIVQIHMILMLECKLS